MLERGFSVFWYQTSFVDNSLKLFFLLSVNIHVFHCIWLQNCCPPSISLVMLHSIWHTMLPFRNLNRFLCLKQLALSVWGQDCGFVSVSLALVAVCCGSLFPCLTILLHFELERFPLWTYRPQFIGYLINSTKQSGYLILKLNTKNQGKPFTRQVIEVQIVARFLFTQLCVLFKQAFSSSASFLLKFCLHHLQSTM